MNNNYTLGGLECSLRNQQDMLTVNAKATPKDFITSLRLSLRGFLFPQSRAYNKSSTNNIVLNGRYPVSCYRPVLLWSGVKGMTYKLHYCKEDYSGYCQKIVCSN
jgi:hypothetical protein